MPKAALLDNANVQKLREIGLLIGGQLAGSEIMFAILIATPGEHPQIAFTSNTDPATMARFLRIAVEKIEDEQTEMTTQPFGHA